MAVRSERSTEPDAKGEASRQGCTPQKTGLQAQAFCGVLRSEQRCPQLRLVAFGATLALYALVMPIAHVAGEPEEGQDQRTEHQDLRRQAIPPTPDIGAVAKSDRRPRKPDAAGEANRRLPKARRSEPKS